MRVRRWLGWGLTLSIGAAGGGACNPLDPFATGFDAVEDAVLYEAEAKNVPAIASSPLVIMTWNIKYAGARLRFFWECNGERGNMTEEEVRENLRGLAGKIRQVGPDILLLQEADVDSKRCAYIDNVQWLLDHTDLNYGAYASQWKADYVPSDGIGRIDSGNAILSRWPIRNAQRLALSLIDADDALTRYFYLKRNILRARIDLPGADSLWVVNTHAEAFAEDDTKKEHIDTFTRVLSEIDARGEPFVAGGDLNAVPPGTEQQSDFPDDDCDDARFEGDDYTGQEAWLGDLFALFVPAISANDYRADNRPYFSFTGDERVGWTRLLDYLFTNRSFVADSGLVHQGTGQGGYETLPLSDHAPVTAAWTVQP